MTPKISTHLKRFGVRSPDHASPLRERPLKVDEPSFPQSYTSPYVTRHEAITRPPGHQHAALVDVEQPGGVR